MVTARLVAAGCIAADEEAAELMAATSDEAALESALCRREQGEPLAWIVGSSRFCDHEVRVDPGTYVPRPQTEELARRALRLLNRGRHATAIEVDSTIEVIGTIEVIERCGRSDLCTGTGAVAVHLKAERPDAVVIGVDIDAHAAACARRNGVPTVVADLTGMDPPLLSGCFDIMTAVPPYVPTGEIHLLPVDVQRYEPRQSLDGGSDGLSLVRRVVDWGAGLLRPGGWLLMELGADEDVALAPMLAASGFGPADRWTDDDGDLRGIATRFGPSPLDHPGAAPAR